MHLLWLTRKYPDPPDSGELIYSSGLIRSTAAAGAAITVFCRGDRRADFTDNEPVRWQTISPAEPRRPLRSLLSALPSDSCRLASHGGRKALHQRRPWPGQAILIHCSYLGAGRRLFKA